MTIDDAFDAWKRRAADADILDVARSKVVGAVLRKTSREHVGACPRGCSASKRPDGFAVNPGKQVFNCRPGGVGGNVISMVMHCRAVDFLAACEIITGEAPPERGTQLTAEQRAKAEKQIAASQATAAKRTAAENKWREDELHRVAKIWAEAKPFAGSSAQAYIERRRGLATAALDNSGLRCAESFAYTVERDGPNGREYEVVHRGPAMLAPIVDAAGEFRALHITYLDLAETKGKLNATDPQTGDKLDAKKSRGSKRGNRIELIGPRAPTTLVIAEGIEKAIAIYCGLELTARPGLEQWGFWSACDLGNMSGPAIDTAKHPTARHEKSGRPKSVAGMVPDFDAPGLVIPDSVTDLVLLGDVTSDPFATQLAMCRAAARFAAPGRTVRVAWAPDGKDFDDLWREAGRDAAARALVAEQIAAIVDAAAAPIAPQLAPADVGQGDAPRARKRAPKGAAQIEPQETGDGAAGAPHGLPGADAAPPDDAAPMPPGWHDDVPPHAAASAADPAENDDETSHSGRRPGTRSANRARWDGPGRKYGTGRDALNKWLAFFPMTELGLIERYVQREKGRLCYCEALGWLWWDGKKWSREGAEAKAIAAGHDTVRAVQDEAEAILGTEFDELISEKTVGKGDDAEIVRTFLSDLLMRFGRGSETKSAMTLHKHALAYLSHEVEAFDADHMLLNIENGTLVFSREPFARDEPLPPRWIRHNDHIRLKPHDPADRITKIASVAYRRDATCPLYAASMETWQPDKSYRVFLDLWDGYSLTADASEQKLVLNIGTGKNGKSTWTTVKLRLLGDYGGSIPITSLIDSGKARSAGQATPDLAKLRGLRMLLTSEPPKGWKLDEGLVKDLTGGDKVSVRELNKGYFDLDPRFKLTIAGNHKPELSAGEAESGIWRRTALVYWKVTIPEAQRDLRLVDKLIDEGPGILNRWLAGLTDWLQHGLRIPAEIAAATEEFRSERDVLGRFLKECTEQQHAHRAGVTATHELFVAWAKASGEQGRHEWTPKGLGQALKERGFVAIKASIMVWVGFKLTKEPAEFGASSSSPSSSSTGGSEPPPHDAPPDGRADDDDEPF
jgi:putative DNA primase/helicase